jgi:hypothetical protein
MRNRNMTPAFGGLLFMAVTAFGQTTVTTNYAPSPTLPPVGLAATETVQVNVVNTAAAFPNGTVPSCSGTITFYNAHGSVIGTPTSFTVGSGQILSVTLPYASTGASGLRTVVRAGIATMETIAGFGIPPCVLGSSLETYDSATGVTHTFVAGGPVPVPIVPGVVVLEGPAKNRLQLSLAFCK